MKKILLILAMLAVLMMTACTKEENVENNSSVEVIDAEKQEEIQKTEDQDVDTNNKQLISFEELNDKISVPIINIDSEDVKNLNEKLRKEFEEDVLKDNESFAKTKYNVADNVLSLLIEKGDGVVDFSWYFVYNVDINTGKLLSTSDILGEVKSKELMDKLPEICKEEFYKYWGDKISDRDDDDLKFYLEENAKFVASDINDVPLYIDEANGKQIIIKVASFAGPSYFEHIVNLNEHNV